MTRHQRAVLEALTDCHDGAATVAWIADYTQLPPKIVAACLWYCQEYELVAHVGGRRIGPTTGRVVPVFAATITGRRLVGERLEAA